MSKWVNVKAFSVKEVLVEIEDDQTEDDAVNFAAGELSDYSDFESHTVEPKSVEQYKRHADEVYEL